MASCRTRGRARSMAIGSTGPTSRSTATVSIRTSCCSILTPRRSSASSNGTRAVRLQNGNRRRPHVRRRDSAPFMPRCRVIDPAFTWGDDRAPRTAWERTIIYELHVRGYTKLHPGVPEELRGTFRGLAEPEVLEHIRSDRRDRGRAAAGPHLRQRQLSARKRADQLLGLQHDLRSFRRRGVTPTCRISLSPNSRRWSRAFTTPASR